MRLIKRHMLFSTLALAVTIGAGPAALVLTTQPASAQAAGGGGGGGSGGGGGNPAAGNPALEAIVAARNPNDRPQRGFDRQDKGGCAAQNTSRHRCVVRR